MNENEKEVKKNDEPQCSCYELVGDNPTCPVHGKKK